MKKFFILINIFIFNFVVFGQQNDFFIRLSQKELATFNDAITLMRLVYNENDDKDIFIENILWAAGKKLFQVTIPINPDKINPIITRKEFAYWCYQIFNLKQEKVRTQTTKYLAYQYCVNVGIMSPGRGQEDSFTGQELLDTFAYLLYYVKYKNIQPVEGDLSIKNDYEYLPLWRQVIYRELDEQQALEKKKNADKRKAFKEKLKVKKQEMKQENEVKEKFIDNTGDKK